jgi:hypothetical protein
MQVENGISTKRSMVETAIKFENMEIKDMAFFNDRSLLVLHVSEGKYHFARLYQISISQFTEARPMLLSIPYQVEDVVLSYQPSLASKTVADAHSIDDILPHCEAYSFPSGSSFVPDKFELSQRNNHRNRIDSARLCFLDKNQLHYKVFAVPKYVSGPVTMDEDVSMT